MRDMFFVDELRTAINNVHYSTSPSFDQFLEERTEQAATQSEFDETADLFLATCGELKRQNPDMTADEILEEVFACLIRRNEQYEKFHTGE